MDAEEESLRAFAVEEAHILSAIFSVFSKESWKNSKGKWEKIKRAPNSFHSRLCSIFRCMAENESLILMVCRRKSVTHTLSTMQKVSNFKMNKDLALPSKY